MRAIPALLAAAVLLGACGEKKLSGKADVPSGYRAVSSHGASFAVPSAFKAQPEQSFANGAITLRLQDGDDHIDLNYRAGDPTRFEALKRQYRVVLTSVDSGKITQDKPITVEGADAANLIEADLPDDRKVSSLQVRRGSDTYVLVAQSDDPGTVIDAFRLRPGTGTT